MAVIKLKAKKTAQMALPLMERQLILPMLMTTVSADHFKGAQNDTVNFKVTDASYAFARDYDFRGRTGPIVLDDIYQAGGNFPVRLNRHIYSATGLEDEHLTLDEIDFASEVLAPQVAAVVGQLEDLALAFIKASTSIKHTITFGDDADPHLVAVEAKRVMDAEKVAPTTGRVFVVGNNIAAHFRASDRLARYDSSASTSALRDAVIGQLSGSPVIEHNGIDPNEGFYMHGTSFLFANVAPVVPRGVTYGQTGISKNGLAVRHICDYDPAYLRDRSIVSSFAGVAEIRDERNPDGSWIVEEGEFSADELAVMRNRDNSPVVPKPVGTRKNVRILKLKFTGSESVLPA